jgi:hypothetical protein
MQAFPAASNKKRHQYPPWEDTDTFVISVLPERIKTYAENVSLCQLCQLVLTEEFIKKVLCCQYAICHAAISERFRLRGVAKSGMIEKK